jgi:HicB family
VAPKRLNLRVPHDLHNALEDQARRQGCSLNALALALLAGSIGWQAVQDGEAVPLDLDRLRAFRDRYAEQASSPKGRVKGWSVAKSSPHEYAVRERAAVIGLEAEFDHFIAAIRHHGTWQRWGGRDYCYLTLDDRRYWVMRTREEPPAAWTDPNTTWIINRSRPDDQVTMADRRLV